MATKKQIEEQDRASANRRTEAAGRIIDTLEDKDTHPHDATKGLALEVLDSLLDGIAGDIDDAQTLRRKGWQSAVKRNEDAADVVRYWRDLLVGYEAPKGRPTPLPVEHNFAGPERAQSVGELERRLSDAFGPELMPTRHIRTTIEDATDPDATGTVETKHGALCGEKTGSWTHPGGANCTSCHALYAEQAGQPYAGPMAYGNTFTMDDATGKPVELTADALKIEMMDPMVDAAQQRPSDGISELEKIPDGGRRDEPITPIVAREIREEIQRDHDAAMAGLPGLRMPEAVAQRALSALSEGAAVMAESVNKMLTPTLKLVDPSGPRVRQRLTLEQVQQHGAARNRGHLHRSVSQVEGYSDCGTRYALSDKEAPAWWNVGGKAFHRCAEEINRFVAADGAPEFDAPETMWLRMFDAEIADQHAATPGYAMSEWRTAKKGAENYDFWRVEGPVMVKKYVTWLRGMLADGWEIARTRDGRPVIELEIYTNVGAQVPNLSIVDLALVHFERDLLLVVDCKAGASAPKNTFQLGVYGWALLGELDSRHAYANPERVRAVYYRARTGEAVPSFEQRTDFIHIGWPILAMHPWNDVVTRYRSMDAMERQHFYMPNVTNFCGGCGVRDLCPAMSQGGADGRTEPEATF